jgi:polyhydroxyalkanoate synthesis regulator phasin
MAQDFEQLFKGVFGDQIDKITTRLHDIAREAVKDDITRLTTEVTELRTRLARLEEERAENAAESLESSF